MAIHSETKLIVTNSKAQVAWVVLCALFALLLLRLSYLQIIKGEYFKALSENNRIRLIYIPAQRGIVYDRNGVVLAKNRPSFDVELVREDSPKPLETVSTLEKVLSLEPDSLKEVLVASSAKRRKYESVRLLRDVSRDEIARVIAHSYELPGIIINPSTTREYVYPGLATHLIGYIREITQRQLDAPDFVKYRSGDFVGQSGIESTLESFLNGGRGIQEVIVNALGAKLGESKYEPASPGDDVMLSIDVSVQRAAEEALGSRKGAVVALDPHTGEVLALVSHPTFDANIFTRRVSPQTWDKLTSADEKALNNRAVQGLYPPGSVFKIFMALAALTEGVTTPHETVFCPGYFKVGSKKFLCHKHAGHGSVNLIKALAGSCDTYFYTMGLRLGIDRIHEHAIQFGFAKKTGIELGDEPSGLIPSTAWKKKMFKNAEDQKWYAGETPSVVIGQGAVTVTPLQVARALAAFVNGGKLLVPQIIKKITSPDGSFEDQSNGAKLVEENFLDPKFQKVVADGLIAVVNGEEGTGAKARLSKDLGIVVAGKTGTAQVISLPQNGKKTVHGDHAWFAGYAPAEKPEIVVVAIVEGAGHGGAVAAPVVSTVMEKYFRNKMDRVHAH
jgi:penicillin-binding protein 2